MFITRLIGPLLSLVLPGSAMAAETETLVPQEFLYAGQKVFAYGPLQSEIHQVLNHTYSPHQIFMVTTEASFIDKDNVLNLMGWTTFVARDNDGNQLKKNLSRFKFNGGITGCEPDWYIELQEAHIRFLQLNETVSSMNSMGLSTGCSDYKWDFNPSTGGTQ